MVLNEANERGLILKRGNVMRNKLIMKYPASWHGDMWREAVPVGNGEIGGLVYGGAYKETIALIHGKLWTGAKTPELPDVSDVLPEMRRLLCENKPIEAEFLMSDKFRELGYEPAIGKPLPLCDIEIIQKNRDGFSGYRRILDMETAEAEVLWKDGDCENSRRFFISRENDTACLLMTAKNGHIDADITLKVHDEETLENAQPPENAVAMSIDGGISYAATDEGKDFGAVMKVYHDGVEKNENGILSVSKATYIAAFMKLFIYDNRETAIPRLEKELTENNYEEELEKHSAIHKKLFCAQKLGLGGKDYGVSNEELMLQAYEGKAPVELVEKLWSFGRYLLICAAREKGSPCHLLGVWTGGYESWWAFNMFNVNLEMIYWQAQPGNKSESLKSVFDYIDDKMDDYRENARKLYGCRGINIPSVSTPESGLHKNIIEPHILHWTAGAAWMAEFYYDYYLYTADYEFLKNRAMPFMNEAAEFFEDFLYEGEDGYLEFSPSNSPENTAKNIMDIVHRNSEVAVNATMDVAAVKELLTNLIKGSEITGMYKEKVQIWQNIIDKLPPYRINKDGAVAEWLPEFYEDNYNHRHQSHVYPVFPGHEVTRLNNPELYAAFEKAMMLRKTVGLKDQTGWSLMYMANVFARMGMGDEVDNCIDYLTRSVLLPNFLTVHNDWRRMGVAYCKDIRYAPVQLDANMGLTAALIEALVFSTEDEIYVFNALPTSMKNGFADPIQTRTCSEISLSWSEDEAEFEIYHKGADRKVTISLPKDMVFADSGERILKVTLEKGKKYKYLIKRV